MDSRGQCFVYDFEKFEPVDVLRMIHDYGITSFCAPPTVFRFLIREDLSKYNLSTLRYCTIAGEALNPVSTRVAEAYRHQADGRVRPDRDHSYRGHLPMTAGLSQARWARKVGI